jgi:hypothetical protein
MHTTTTKFYLLLHSNNVETGDQENLQTPSTSTCTETPTMICIEDNFTLPLQFEGVHDILDVMRVQESTTYVRNWDVDELNALWRRLLVEWMYYVVDYCQLQRQSVGAASFFLDVTMYRGLIQTREEYQLAAATALQLSLKTFDSAVIQLEKLVKLGRGSFTEEDVVRMECKILKCLNWRVHPPSTYCFLSQYELLLPSSMTEPTREMLVEVTKLVSELSVIDHKYNYYRPSVLAYATMLMAMELIDHVDLPVHQRQCFVMHMSTVAKQHSKSPLVLKAFEELKKTLDTCSKLPGLMQCLSVARIKKAKEEPTTRSKAKESKSKEYPPPTKQSPRHVMARLVSS